MAHFASNSFPLEFNFIDNPIMVGVTSMSFPADSTFRQAVVEVSVFPSFTGATTSTYYFYADASAADTVWIDISSALRAAMNAWQPDVANLTAATEAYKYPYATFSAAIYEKYLLEGNVVLGDKTSRTDGYAYYGGLSEYELFTFSKHASDLCKTLTFTRKPSSKEVNATGDKVLTSSYTNLQVQTTQATIGDGDFAQGEMTQFLFVNSLGVFETVSAFSRESLSYGIESEKKNLASTPQYKAKPGITTHKTGGRAKFEMSSGFVDREWADWWTTEFLMAKRYWMRYADAWLPVTVTPADDTTVIYDRSEQRLPHVDFDVEVAVSGSIMNQASK